jgi:hypothetical protein
LFEEAISTPWLDVPLAGFSAAERKASVCQGVGGKADAQFNLPLMALAHWRRLHHRSSQAKTFHIISFPVRLTLLLRRAERE